MKPLLLPLIAAGTLLPFSQLPAQDTAADTKTYGGFAPGRTFSLTVTERSTKRTKGFKVSKDVSVPDGVPDFKVDQKVKFTIGGRGQLKGPGFSISYEGQEKRVNFYSNNPTFSNPEGEAATVRKTSTNKPKSAALTFYRFEFSGLWPVTTTVSYVLE